jgi:hypothetical protein
MKIGATRDDIARDIRLAIFSKPILSLVAPSREMIKIITSPFINEFELFSRLVKNVNDKLSGLDAKLEEIYYREGRKKKVVNKENADKIMHKLLFEDSTKLIFRVKIKNKYFEFTTS